MLLLLLAPNDDDEFPNPDVTEDCPNPDVDDDCPNPDVVDDCPNPEDGPPNPLPPVDGAMTLGDDPKVIPDAGAADPNGTDGWP